MARRKLTGDEISSLQSNNCKCSDWDGIEVAEGFSVSNLANVTFCGKVIIGKFDGEIQLAEGVVVQSGIYNSFVNNCSIGDNAYINDVKLLSNYQISANVIINNVAKLSVEGETYFGNGTEIDIVNEGGGRTLKIFDKLSSNLAYILVFYRHNKKLIEALENVIDEYSSGKKSPFGFIANNCRIENCGSIVNVNFGDSAHLSGCLNLTEGTVASSASDPVFMGTNVTAKNFIILSGANIDDGALLHHCFVGQGVKMGKQYSAENSAFFANSEAFHGEACSVFGGPYTVTHHKSSLLIAGYYSFYNAGSGTNQSNHMYKLGPLHQGILERGSKTGSFSYMLWPCRTAPFTTILGKHYVNFDTSNLPFSYINEDEGKSFVTPALNLFAVGTRRDSQKWKKRDRRKDQVKLDLINFDLFSPYIVGRMVDAIAELNTLYENTPKSKQQINYKGIQLKRLLIKSSRKYYEMGVRIFIGNCLVKKMDKINNDFSWSDIKSELAINTDKGLSKWLDVGGLLAPDYKIDLLVNRIENRAINSIDDIQNELTKIQADYDKFEWEWCAALIEKKYNIQIGDITPEIALIILNEWKSDSIRLNKMIENDARKEFDAFAKIGFGIDGDESVKDSDFEAVRGSADENSFINELKTESAGIERTADLLIGKITYALKSHLTDIK